ncbi:hypothetical protein FKD06_25475 [Serratia sp. SRS-8-S-2018]|uniref:plasmid fertility inhibition factor family protein n=1 Tax=Serratia sp. SRS-8-S-2018 TaxID=2591107 RepID=UPI00114001B3|nr:hypothetical protein [Serratia sp. SRS-8-S-2018]TPW37869.1 hypothetical protein FKD06_25475 [Serratia sp. SRS-8-S-2018]
MTPDLIGKHVAIKDYQVHLVEGVYSCRYNDSIYCRFKIPLRQGEFAYMEQAISDTSEHYIVVADRDKLLSAWRNTPNSIVPELSRGDEAAWRRDRKFHEAERCFSIGAGNPVPLATPTCRFILERGLPVPALDFVDGITRTIWLLANGADRLPVHAYNHHDALLLQRGIGHRAASPVSVKTLFFLYAGAVLPRHLRYKAAHKHIKPEPK